MTKKYITLNYLNTPPRRKKEIPYPTDEMAGVNSAKAFNVRAEASMDDAMTGANSANASRGRANGFNDSEMAFDDTAKATNDKEIDSKIKNS